MPEMTLQRVPFSQDADNRLRALKSRTGITPNILCRMGFCLSLEEQGRPALVDASALQGRVINRFTLLGEHDDVFIALLVTWMQVNGIQDLSTKSTDGYFLAHIHRGVDILISRINRFYGLEWESIVDKIENITFGKNQLLFHSLPTSLSH